MHNLSLRLLFVVTLALSLFLSGCGTSGNPRVLLQTELGDITIEIFENEAPITAPNFLR